MAKIDQSMLALLLEDWFKDHDINDRNILYRNPVAQTISKNLKLKGRWKNLPRGKPYTGPPEKDPF